MENPFRVFDQIRKAYLRYLDSPFRLRYDALLSERRDLLDQDRQLYRLPLIEPVWPLTAGLWPRQLAAALAQGLQQRNTDEWLAELRAADIPCGRVYDGQGQLGRDGRIEGIPSLSQDGYSHLAGEWMGRYDGTVRYFHLLMYRIRIRGNRRLRN